MTNPTSNEGTYILTDNGTLVTLSGMIYVSIDAKERSVAQCEKIWKNEIERLRKAVFMAHAELGEGSACGCGCDDCKAYMTDGSSEPQP